MNEYHELGGTIRARTAEQTLEIIQPYIKKAGITRLANLTGLDNIGIPVYTCIRPLSKNLSTSQGKGITDSLAKCSAYMEAIEHYYSENVATNLTASIDELTAAGHTFIHPANMPPAFFVNKFTASTPLSWTLGSNLIDDQPYYVPTEILSMDFSENAATGFFFKETTGLASGNNRDEALCHALYEVIERNCSNEFNSLPLHDKNLRAIDANTIDYAAAVAILEKLQQSQVDVVIFDTTNRFGVPTFHSIICDNNPLRGLGRYAGFGTHFNKGIALCRALTEAIQSRLTFIAGSRDDMFPDCYKTQAKIQVAVNKNYQQSLAYPDESLPQQLKSLLNILQNNGYEQVIAVTHTRSDDAIAVVHTLIPKLQTTTKL